MKRIACYEESCDLVFEHDDRDAILSQMLGHYQTVHPTVIPNASDEAKKAWMEQFDKDWVAA